MSQTITREMIVQNADGLHMRPMQKFVAQAQEFTASVSVEKNGKTFDGKSILDLLMLMEMSLNEPNLCQFSFTVHCKGADAQKCIDELESLVNDNFRLPFERVVTVHDPALLTDHILQTFVKKANTFNTSIELIVVGNKLNARSIEDLNRIPGLIEQSSANGKVELKFSFSIQKPGTVQDAEQAANVLSKFLREQLGH